MGLIVHGAASSFVAARVLDAVRFVKARGRAADEWRQCGDGAAVAGRD
jgi:hypothetical protein